MGLRSVVHAYGTDGLTASIERAAAASSTAPATTTRSSSSWPSAAPTSTPTSTCWWANYFEHRDRFIGRGNYTEEGFALMEEARTTGYETFRRTLAHGGVKVVYGTDAVAGAHGRNAEELVYRVRDGGQDPMDAIVSATSLAPSRWGSPTPSGGSHRATRPTSWRWRAIPSPTSPPSATCGS